MVVAYLFVIHKGFAGFYGFHGEASRKFAVGTYCTGFQPFFQGSGHVASDVAGICSRIREDFVVLVQALHNVQSLFCGEAEFFICISLKLSQIVEARREGLFCSLVYGFYGKGACLNLF